MRIGMSLNYAGGFAETVEELADYERAGLDIVFVPEAYSYDAVSQLGFIAARTSRLQIASGILQLYSRTPALTAMTAAGLDYVSGGRFNLGLGASGPQVIEGWHGVPYDAPLGRTREIIDICRKVWARERLEYQGRYYQIPLPPGRGTGLGKPGGPSEIPRSDRSTWSPRRGWPSATTRAGSSILAGRCSRCTSAAWGRRGTRGRTSTSTS
jgi:F420-dependent oxidoreductase-like protein